MSLRAAPRVGLVIAVVLLAQSTVGLDLRIAGVHPDLVWLLPIAAGLTAGPQEGALVGFVAGLGVDLFLPTPLGLTALVGCLLGFGVGRATAGLSTSGPWLSIVAALAGSTAAVMLYAVLGAVLGQEQMLRVDLGSVVAVVAGVNALLVLPTVRTMRRALGSEPTSRRRTLASGARW
ncbi:MAG TPA: rod shape-determining protein MreD [Acidimicrobiales bacterium]|nr:rod shape-determining protein MreD [Acidimicrobiales bacterium]